MRRSKFALSICLILSVVIGLSVLSSCGGGGGSRPVTKPGDEVIITPPGNRAPVVSQAFENIALPLAPDSQWESEPLGNYFSDPDDDTLRFDADTDNSNVASVEFSDTGLLIVRAQGSGATTITVTATDPDEASTSQRFSIIVAGNPGVVGPQPDDHSNTPEGATQVTAGVPIVGSIDSTDDVDYFSFTPPDSGIYEIALDTDIAGVELLLLDDRGNVIATDQTKSLAQVVLVATVGFGLIAVMNEDHEEWITTGRLPTPEELTRDIALLGVDQAFKIKATKKVLAAVRICKIEVCQEIVGQAVGYTIDFLKRLPIIKSLEELIFAGTLARECNFSVEFTDHGFFSPSRYLSEVTIEQYIGECRNGAANGIGRYAGSNATGQRIVYNGEWRDGEPHGEGNWHIRVTNFGEFRYEGEWQNGQPNGQGIGAIDYNNGNTWHYDGPWVDGNPHGRRGTWTALTYGDRFRYVGAFRNGLQHGQGVETNTYVNGDRERLEGEFRNDVLWNGTSTWNGVSCRVVNGAEC